MGYYLAAGDKGTSIQTDRVPVTPLCPAHPAYAQSDHTLLMLALLMLSLPRVSVTLT